MRTFGSGFTTKLSSSSYNPVIFCKYELVTYVSGAFGAGSGTQTTTNFYWAEREIEYDSQTYEPRLVNTSPLEQELDASNQVFGEMGLQISNKISNIAGVIQAGMKCTVYLGFEDSIGSGTVTDAEVIYIGIVEGDIEITEDSVSFNLQDIANVYDRQLPNLITRDEYPFADPDSIGDTKPIIMGRAKDVQCRPVASGFASVLGADSYGRTYDHSSYKEGLPPIISMEGDTYIYVADDIGWWKEAIETAFVTYPPMTINTTTLTDIYGNNITGYCSIAGHCSNPDYSHNSILCEDTYGETWTDFDTQALCESNGGTWHSADENIQVTSIEFDKSVNLWKLNLAEPLKTDHFVGDTVYENGETLCSSLNEGYAFLVADHPVESITNVKVDGLPVYAVKITNHQTPLTCPDWNLPTGKAYVIVGTQAGLINKGGAGSLAINDTTDVSDTIAVDDTINVNEDGHAHDMGGVRTFNYTFDINYQAIRGDIYIEAGQTKIYIRDLTNNIFLPSPISFTSQDEICHIVIEDTVSWMNIKGERTDNLGNTSYMTKTLGRTSGFIPLKFPAGIGGQPTTTVDAGVYKTGSATKSGSATKVGQVKLTGGNSASDVLVGQRVTCDVIGICDGSTGYVTPHNQIKKLINTFARNPIVGTEGNADIVQFVNESEMDTAFDKVYNTDNASNSGASLYPALNTWSYDTENPSPTADLLNTDTTEGFHSIDFAIIEPNRLRDIVGDMLFHSNSTINWRNGIAYIKYSGDTLSNDQNIENDDLIMQTTSLARSRASDLATEITVRYDHSPAKDFARRYDYAERIGSGDFFTKTELDAIRARGKYSKERAYDLPMARDQITAEFIAKRLYDKYASPKFEVGICTVLKNLATEVGDYVTVKTPIYANGVLDKGLITRRTIEFGSAVDKNPDLIHITVKENHTGDGFYLQTDALSDTLSLSDSAPYVELNNANTLFLTLTDSMSFSESINVGSVLQLNDSLSITESRAFEFEVSLSDTLSITDTAMKFTGILFWDVQLTDSVGITDGTPYVYIPELLTTESGDDVLTEAGAYVELE